MTKIPEPEPHKLVLARSNALINRARRSEALIDARPSLFFTGYERIGGVPTFVSRAKGPYVWDVDGNRYIDLLLGYGSVILGHAHPAVNAAAIKALQSGANPTLLTETQIDLAEKIVELVPTADKVTFFRTGSDAVAAAVRLARTITQKRHVLRWGINGWHDWCAREAPGVLDEVKAFTHEFRYGDIENLKQLFDVHHGDVACVVMMPFELELPEEGYFESIRQLCDQHGALLVLDEVRSGFRVALGGAQEIFGIEADLTAFSKAMGNGHAISALTGRGEWMAQILELHLTITFYRSPVHFAAALATLNTLESMDGLTTLASHGDKLMTGMSALISNTDVLAHMSGHPTTPGLVFDYPTDHDNERAMRIFCSAMLRHGVLINPMHHWFLSTATKGPQILSVLTAAETALAQVARRI